MAEINDGVFLVEPDHPVCEKCVSSLHREERCNECGGDRWIINEDDMGFDDESPFVKCPECHGEPTGWYCPTCNRRWRFNEITLEDDE
jgi:DnaJ-class molecular chaperone